MLIAALAAVGLASCGPQVHWTERAAHDRIMLVRDNPPTLGHRRLLYQSVEHPDLAKFLDTQGLPDFIAETSSDDRLYLILYYLRSRHAYACRSWRGQSEGMEFAGPYPMTEHETKILIELREGTAPEAPEHGIGSGRLIVP